MTAGRRHLNRPLVSQGDAARTQTYLTVAILRRKSRLNPFEINQPQKGGFHRYGWVTGPWELKIPQQEL
jgi:hypothetical protein